MKLMTQEVIKGLPKLYAQENVEDAIVHVKFFTPDAGWTWFVTEGEQKEYDHGMDWLFFGKCVSPMCPDGEWGYTTLGQLQEVRGSLGLPVERDMHFSKKPASECK